MTHGQKIAKIKKLVSDLEIAAYDLSKASRDCDAKSEVRLQNKIVELRREIIEKLEWL